MRDRERSKEQGKIGSLYDRVRQLRGFLGLGLKIGLLSKCSRVKETLIPAYLVIDPKPPDAQLRQIRNIS